MCYWKDSTHWDHLLGKGTFTTGSERKHQVIPERNCLGELSHIRQERSDNENWAPNMEEKGEIIQ